MTLLSHLWNRDDDSHHLTGLPEDKRSPCKWSTQYKSLASAKAPLVSEKWWGGSVFLEEPLSLGWDLSSSTWSWNPREGSRWAHFQTCPHSWSQQVSGNWCQCRLPFTTSPGPSFQRYPWWAGSVLTRAELMLVVTGDASRWPMIAYGDRCWICDLRRTKFLFGTKHSASVTWSFILLQWKWDRESFWYRHQKGTESAPVVWVGLYIVFQLVTNNRSKEYLKVVKVLPGPLPQHTS